MAQAAKPTRHHRTLTVDFHHEATYFALCSDGKVCIEFVLAFFLSSTVVFWRRRGDLISP